MPAARRRLRSALPLLTLAFAAALPGPALAGSSPGHSFTVRNETGYTINLAAYDLNDRIRNIPTQDAQMTSVGPITLKCNTNDTCQLEASMSLPPPYEHRVQAMTLEVRSCVAIHYLYGQITSDTC